MCKSLIALCTICKDVPMGVERPCRSNNCFMKREHYWYVPLGTQECINCNPDWVPPYRRNNNNESLKKTIIKRVENNNNNTQHEKVQRIVCPECTERSVSYYGTDHFVCDKCLVIFLNKKEIPRRYFGVRK